VGVWYTALAMGGAATTMAPGVNVTDTEPVQCGIDDICDCQSIEVRRWKGVWKGEGGGLVVC
jgi:hypothetical protein